MSNPFPDINPSLWEPQNDRAHELIRARQPGLVQINIYDPANVFTAHGEWRTLVRSKFDVIEDHWHGYTGPFALFNFFSRKIRNEYVGVGNGTTRTFALPAKAVSGVTARLSGVVQSGASFTVSSGTGVDGCDEITFAVAPANGAVITFDATDARRRYTVTYASGSFPDRNREADVWIITLDFEEALEIAA